MGFVAFVHLLGKGLPCCFLVGMNLANAFLKGLKMSHIRRLLSTLRSPQSMWSLLLITKLANRHIGSQLRWRFMLLAKWLASKWPQISTIIDGVEISKSFPKKIR